MAQHFWKWRPAWWRTASDKFAFFVALFTAVLAVVAGLQTCVLKNQLTEMKNEQRPWIGVPRIESRKWPEIDGDVVNFALAFILKNYGHSPAVVRVTAAIIWDPQETIWNARQKHICDDENREVRINGWGEQWTVLPNDEWPYYLPKIPLDTNVSQIQQVTGGLYTPLLVGCVVYRSSVNPDLRQSAFVGTLSVENPDAHLPRDNITKINIRDTQPPSGKKLVVKAVSITGDSN
jgi:hypothetical protein